ncbi:Por secretion system C-terminal sorting domain-containing protein [Kaistella chaponensis]|uniref:Por secretion system C-terminal sorting domain-containing protein n=1 Tax=Kaistella chaponensis TaxID=713588 RepID=A0A1N7J452_9FLAO|nr:T9SS type A sorting domain-containing protein [Kaistella chaponensis]SIS44026.1 Por secretion system C-terminal sorting domain-containing protein [Kaistella chaponensis]
MKKFLLLLLLPIFQWYSSQITFQTYVYSFGPQPYNAMLTGNGTIYYTTDGTNPTLNSMSGLNEVNISISKVLTVKAMLKNSSNQLSQVFSKKYYFGPFPSKTVYFKKPPTWTNACSFSNSNDPQVTIDFFSGPPMTPVCEGWLKGNQAFFVGQVTFDNCVFPPMSPLYQYFNIVTEDTVYYDYSSGPITNPPACLLATNDPGKKIAVVKIYPNPVQEFFNIDSDIDFENYEIIDFNGKSVRQNKVAGKKINVSLLPAGTYFIRLMTSGNLTHILKFIKN